MHGSVDKYKSYPGRGDFFLSCPVPHCHGVIFIVLDWCKIFSLASLMKTNRKYSVTSSIAWDHLRRAAEVARALASQPCGSGSYPEPGMFVVGSWPWSKVFSPVFLPSQKPKFQVLIQSRLTNSYWRLRRSSSVFRMQVNFLTFFRRPTSFESQPALASVITSLRSKCSMKVHFILPMLWSLTTVKFNTDGKRIPIIWCVIYLVWER